MFWGVTMKKIFSDYREYNANTKYVNTGDCVKRSLSLAYDMDYDAVSNELNAIKRSQNGTHYNVSRVFTEFIQKHGVDKYFNGSVFAAPSYLGLSYNTTVEEFSNKFSDGTYLVLCGKSKERSTHMVCIIDGDIWDSWNSSSWYVVSVCIVKSSKSTVYEQTVSDYVDDVIAFLNNYLDSITKSKMPYGQFSILTDMNRVQDNYGYIIYVQLEIDDDILDKLGVHRGSTETHRFIIRMNPRMSYDDNIKSIESKLRYQAREWAWSCRKTIQDRLDMLDMSVNPEFAGNRSLLLKIPERFRSKVRVFRDRGSNDQWDRYYLVLDADPNDPRYSPYDDDVSFYAESIKELKGMLDDYEKHFYRMGYDY